MAVSQLLWFAFSSGGAVVALCAVVLLLRSRPRSVLGVRLCVATAAFYFAASIYAVPEAIGRLLVNVEPLRLDDLPSGQITIVVLGAGSETVTDWDGRRYVTTDRGASARVLEAVRIFRSTPSATVISSGGLLRPTDPGTPTGEAMAQALLSLGIPESQLLVETVARNTHEEAVVVAQMLRRRPPAPVVLVTVDLHMRRAVGTFNAAGIRVIPAIARSPDADLTSSERWLPSNRGLWHSGFVVHEVLGIAYYVMRGWFSFAPPTQAANPVDRWRIGGRGASGSREGVRELGLEEEGCDQLAELKQAAGTVDGRPQMRPLLESLGVVRGQRSNLVDHPAFV